MGAALRRTRCGHFLLRSDATTVVVLRRDPLPYVIDLERKSLARGHTDRVNEDPSKASNDSKGNLSCPGREIFVGSWSRESFYSSGGGGDPLDRDPAKVLDDVLDEFISVPHAEDLYAVFFDQVDDGYGYAVNATATTVRRADALAVRMKGGNAGNGRQGGGDE